MDRALDISSRNALRRCIINDSNDEDIVLNMAEGYGDLRAARNDQEQYYIVDTTILGHTSHMT